MTKPIATPEPPLDPPYVSAVHPVKNRPDDGYVRKLVRIPKTEWDVILAHAENKTLDVDKWLTKEICKLVETLEA